MKGAPPKPRSGAKGPPRAKAGPARRPAQAARTVWTGAKKRIGVSPLQLALPGMGTTL